MARQSLVERGTLVPGEPFRIPVTAARLVEIACRPATSVMIHHGSGPHWSSLHTEQLVERIAMRCKLGAMPAPAGAGVTLPLNVLREAAATGAAETAIALLDDGGAPDTTAESACSTP